MKDLGKIGEGAVSLHGLLARVEAAEGLSEELFADIVSGCFGPFGVDVRSGKRLLELIEVAAWTDAALALVERVLGECMVRFSGNSQDASASVVWRTEAGVRSTYSQDDDSSYPGPALAVIAALLKALIAQAEVTTASAKQTGSATTAPADLLISQPEVTTLVRGGKE